MRLTVEENREAIKRYRHVKPAGRGSSACATRCPGVSRSCSREMGHTGPHVAHGRLGKVLAVWDSGSRLPVPAGTARPAPEVRARRVPNKRPVGLPSGGESEGLISALRGVLGRALSSPDEVVFFVLFVLFVKFAIDWLLLMMR